MKNNTIHDPVDFTGYTLPSGTILHDHYRTERVLGEGGFAIIYQCTDTINGQTVAIKEYFPSGLAKREHSQGFLFVHPFTQSITQFQKGHRHFLEEARILKECRELPGIVTVHDFFEENQTAYIVMEYIEGLTLEQYVRTNGTLSVSDTVELVLPLIHSLSKVHKKGLIHRDISPDNLILGMDNCLHLIDFGAAGMKQTGNNSRQTVILKKGYAPPEQYLASGNIGSWSDVYALCATMYFAISGCPPIAAIDRLQNDTLRSLVSLADIPPETASVIERGLSLHQAERYKTMAALSMALENPEDIENCKTVMQTVPPEASPSPLRVFYRHYKKVMIPALILCLLAGGGISFIGAGHSQSSPLSAPWKKIFTSSADTKAPKKTPAVSNLIDTLTMINVTGLSQEEAYKEISSLDPVISIFSEKKHSDIVPKGYVINQSVSSGTRFHAGAINELTLKISSGPDTSAKAVKPSPANTPKSAGKTAHNKTTASTKKKEIAKNSADKASTSANPPKAAPQKTPVTNAKKSKPEKKNKKKSSDNDITVIKRNTQKSFVID